MRLEPITFNEEEATETAKCKSFGVLEGEKEVCMAGLPQVGAQVPAPIRSQAEGGAGAELPGRGVAVLWLAGCAPSACLLGMFRV